jgi:ATP-dependent Clp protease ATP-binding subunit ClpX
MSKQKPEQKPLYCSFCGLSDNEVAALIAGPCVYICNKCVAVCFDILADHASTLSPKKEHTP